MRASWAGRLVSPSSKSIDAFGQVFTHRVHDPARFDCELVATLEPLRILHVFFLATDHPRAGRPANMGTTPSLRLTDDPPERTRCAAFPEIDAGCLQQ